MPVSPALRCTALALLLGWLAACSGQKEPAHKLILDTDEVIAAAAGEASKYVPDELAGVQARLDTLRAAYDKQDYATVIGSGPEVLGAAQALATDAASKKDTVLRALNDAWTDLASEIPPEVAAVQSRLDELGRTSPRKIPSGIDVDASKTTIGDAMQLWSKAQAAFAAGNLDEAVSTAKDVKVKVTDAAARLKFELPKTAPT